MRRATTIGACLLSIVATAICWQGASHIDYLQSASANCEDTPIRNRDIGSNITAVWASRQCGMLYGGGPYTVLKLKTFRLPHSLSGATDVIEIEDEFGNFLPDVHLDMGAAVLSGVPDYLKYTIRDNALGMRIRIE